MELIMGDFKQKIVGDIKIVSQSEQTPDEFMEELKSTMAKAMGTDGFEVSIVDLQYVMQTPFTSSLMENIKQTQKTLDKIRESADDVFLQSIAGKKFYCKHSDQGEQEVDVELTIHGKVVDGERIIVVEKVKPRDAASERIECDHCNNDISSFIELKPYNYRAICPHCYTVLDIEFCVNVDHEGTFEEHQYWVTWESKDNVVDYIDDDIEYFTVNGRNDLGMTHKDLIGKKVGLIKILKSGLYMVLDMEDKKAHSIPKYNLDPFKEE